MLGRGRVIVRFKLNESVWIADPKGYFGAVIGMRGKGLKPLLRKEFQRSVSGRIMNVEIRFLLEPPPGDRPKVFQILELSSIKEIAFDVSKRCLDLPLRLSPTLPARNRLAMIMRNEGREGGIEDRPSAFPTEHNRLFVIVETFLRHPAIILEGILMSSDQAVEVSV